MVGPLRGTCLWVGLPVMALTLGLSAMRRLEPVSFVLSGLGRAACLRGWSPGRGTVSAGPGG